MACKCTTEEDEQRNAMKHWEALTNASEQMVEALKHFTTPSTNAINVSDRIEENMAGMKTQIMHEIGVKIEGKAVKDTLESILGLVYGFSNNRN
jgi:hypothetical protein